METPENQPIRRRNGKQVSFEYKLSVIQQINNGQISLKYASKKYDISKSTIEYWMKKLTDAVEKSTNLKELRQTIACDLYRNVFSE